MAKFIAGPVASEIRGSIGGTVFTRNRYGAVMRLRVKPVVSTTEYATAAKARLATHTQGWQALTAAQKLAWDEYARATPRVGALGEQQILTGHVMYVGINTRLDVAAVGNLTDPPVGTPPTPLETMTLTGDIGAGDVSCVFSATPLGANDQLWIQACAVSSSGINYVKNLLRWVATSPGAQATPYVFGAVLQARIGDMQVGMTLHALVSVFNNLTGLVSAPLQHRVVVTST